MEKVESNCELRWPRSSMSIWLSIVIQEGHAYSYRKFINDQHRDTLWYTCIHSKVYCLQFKRLCLFATRGSYDIKCQGRTHHLLDEGCHFKCHSIALGQRWKGMLRAFK